ncbi:MAG: hypothetical protein HFJ41_06665 [Clostridia bacterium]|nr:hypothetical protein [Clostridia bacterium]
MNENLKCNKLKKIGGITLISLIITIVVLIILASVGIYLNLGDNGIFNHAKEAKEVTNKQTATEKINLKITTAQINKYAEKQEMPTLKELSEVLREDSEIQYVTEKSQIASKKYEVGENPTSIYTKLNEYPYEFEINGQLQLASIDGIKITTGDNEISGMKAYVIGSITSYGTSGVQCAANGYSSNDDCFTCTRVLEKNYLTINVLKDMNISIVLVEAGRGNKVNREIQINDSVIDTISMGLGEKYKCEAKVSAGDIIKITATRTSGVRATTIGIFGF